MKKLMILSIFLISGVVVKAQSTSEINQTQTNQTIRIVHGVNSGKLTRREAKALKCQQKRIRTQKRIAKSDGIVTRRERMRIKRAQARANRNIRVRKTNYLTQVY